MKRFLIGIAFGVVLALFAGFLLKPTIRNYLGSFLDEDIIYLNSGTTIHGWILQEDNESYYIRTKSDCVSVPRSRCSAVHKNAPLYYMRALM